MKAHQFSQEFNETFSFRIFHNCIFHFTSHPNALALLFQFQFLFINVFPIKITTFAGKIKYILKFTVKWNDHNARNHCYWNTSYTESTDHTKFSAFIKLQISHFLRLIQFPPLNQVFLQNLAEAVQFLIMVCHVSLPLSSLVLLLAVDG